MECETLWESRSKYFSQSKSPGEQNHKRSKSKQKEKKRGKLHDLQAQLAKKRKIEENKKKREDIKQSIKSTTVRETDIITKRIINSDE